MFPDAGMYTSIFDEQRFRDRIDPQRVHPWPIQRLMRPTERFRSLLPLYPFHFSLLRPPATRLVVSSSSAFAHGVRHKRGARHIAYVHSPMRFAWEQDTYLEASSLSVPARVAGRVMGPWLRAWDRLVARRPDVIVTNSQATRDRIRRYWGRTAEVIHPPVDLDEFTADRPGQGYLLVAARLLGYRRIDLAIKAANSLGREVVVCGDGPERGRLTAMAGPTVRFAGHVPRPELVRLIEGCHALLVPGVEDFGIVVVEAMAAGRPVVAFDGGGATETVVDGITGVLFGEQTAAALAEAIERADTIPFERRALRGHAGHFDVRAFRSAWRELLARQGLADLMVEPA